MMSYSALASSAAEDSDPRVGSAVGAVAIMNGPLPDRDSLLAVLAARIPTLPRLTEVLRNCPFDLGAPRWCADANFDVSHHLHRVAVPHPGDDSTVFGLIADLMGWRLDRDRPLWECWIVEGLSDNRWALLVRTDDRLAVAIAATDLLAQLCDDYAGDRFSVEIGATKEPLQPGDCPPKPTLGLRSWLGGWGHSWVGIATTAARVVGGTVKLAAGLVCPAVTSSPAGCATSARRYAAVEVPLDDVSTVCGAFGVTVNDVALALMSVMLPHQPFGRRPAGGFATAAATGLGRRRLRIMGRDVVRLLPIPPIALGLHGGVAILSYADNLVLGVTADPDAAPGVGELAQGVERAVAWLAMIGTAPRRSTGTRALFVVPDYPLATVAHDLRRESATAQ